MGVPHSTSELEAHGCTKVCSEIGLFLGESGFFAVGFLDLVASLQKPMNDASARLVPIIRYLRTKKINFRLAGPCRYRDFGPNPKKSLRVQVPICSP